MNTTQTSCERARETQREVVAALDAAAIPVRLLLGFEVDLSVAATADPDILRTLCIQDDGSGSACTALIVEMPFTSWPLFFEETIFRLTTGGLMPIIAHPERNDRVQRCPEALEPLHQCWRGPARDVRESHRPVPQGQPEDLLRVARPGLVQSPGVGCSLRAGLHLDRRPHALGTRCPSDPGRPRVCW